MYLPYDIQLIILNKIKEPKDKINFCYASKELYVNNFKDMLDMLKPNIKKYIYKDYYKFRLFLQNLTYTQSEINEIIVEILNRINSAILWVSHTIGSYDLRFIFEILCVDSQYLSNDSYKTYGNFYRHFYPKLKSDIVLNNRNQSKINIQKSKFFRVLQPNFRPWNKKNNNYRVCNYVCI